MNLFIDHNGDFSTTPSQGVFCNAGNTVAVIVPLASSSTGLTAQAARLELVPHKAKIALAAAEWAERAHAPNDVIWGWANRERWLKEPIRALSGYGRTFAYQFFFERLRAAQALVGQHILASLPPPSEVFPTTYGTKAEPITIDGSDRRGLFCKCAKCGLVARCTPSFDFFTLPKKPEAGILCEPCFNATIRAPGLTVKVLKGGPS